MNNNFNINYWLNMSDEKPEGVKNSSSAANNEQYSTLLQVQEVCSKLSSSGICLTDDYADWVEIGFALANELGESGRSFFHELSCMSSKYDAAECDKKYDNCLRTGNGSVTIATFFQRAKDAGVDIRMTRPKQDFCATCADAHIYTEKEEKDNSLIINNNIIMNNFEDTCAIAQTAHDNAEEIIFNSTFSDKIPTDDWCSFLRPILENIETPEGRDKMLLGSMGLTSGLVPDNYYAIYDQREVFTPLNLIIYGNAASGKGDLPHVMSILTPLKREIEAAYQEEMAAYRKELAIWESKSGKGERAERGPEPQEPEFRTPLIPGNSSASAAILKLKANGDWGVIFETEGDVITNSFKTDYGDYSTLLRKSAHHETVAINRMKDKLYLEITKPRLATVITLTFGQLCALFPSFENGLGSRFYIYGLNSRIEWKNPFKVTNKPLSEVFSEMGEKYLELHHEIQKLGDRRIQFVFSDVQQDKFNEYFSDLLQEQYGMQGEGIESFIFRLGLSFTRTAMLLTLLRRYSDWNRTFPLFGEHEQALVCSDIDFQITMNIVDTLVNHTAKVFVILNKEEDRNIFKHHVELSVSERRIYDGLSEKFSSEDVRQTAINLDINPNTARRYISKYLIQNIAKRTGVGHYEKINLRK